MATTEKSDKKKQQAYDYQQQAVETILTVFSREQPGYSLLFQLPTGGGKTVIMGEIARRFMQTCGRPVMILTHRIELCAQTAKTLKGWGVDCQMLTADGENIHINDSTCTVAMVETLKNRIREKSVNVSKVGLLLVDEAHHNSFRKLLKHFPSAYLLGVTATPLSSDAAFPLHETYEELVPGESISSLIGQQFLARPRTFTYDVDTQSLRTGPGGDYSISSSDSLYGLDAMQELLLKAYRKHSEGKKTLIFNNGIATSKKVERLFRAQGYEVRHLDNRTPASERKEILAWFRASKKAILTSVSILTTGFDEPSVQSVILNRATTSLTLYHQMIGRGSRFLDRKRTFSIVDLGNNVARFGHWEDPVDWLSVFADPDAYVSALSESSIPASTGLSMSIRQLFPRTVQAAFDMGRSFEEHHGQGRMVIQDSIRQHAMMCLENADSVSAAIELTKALRPDIEFRVKEYVRETGKGTKNYREWLMGDYQRRLEGMVRRLFRSVRAA